MCPPGYHYSGHMMCGYTLLVPMNQRVINKLSKDCSIKVVITMWADCAIVVITVYVCTAVRMYIYISIYVMYVYMYVSMYLHI